MCPNLSQKVQKEVSQMANRNLSHMILLGGLSVNLNHLKKWIYVVKSNYFRLTPPTSVFFISQINIIHEYTETESKYTGKIGTYSMW